VNTALGKISRFVERIFPKGSNQSGLWALATGSKIVIISSLLMGGMATGLRYLGLLEPAELFAFDSLVRAHQDQDLDSRLTIIGITEEDIQQYGWPLEDHYLADLLAKIQAHQPNIIGLDLYRSSFRPPGEAALVDQLAADNLIAIMNVGSSPSQGDVPPPPTVAPERIGFNDFPTDSDGVIRRNLLFVGGAERSYYSLGLRVVMAYESYTEADLSRDDHYLYLGDIPLKALSSNDGGYQNVDARGYQILLRYHRRDTPADQISFSQVLSGRFDPEQIKGKIVLVGTTAPSSKDVFLTPFSSQQKEVAMPGVVIHAQMVSQLLDIVEGQQALYRFLPQWAEWFWLWGWCLAAGGIAWGIKHPAGLFAAISLSIGGVVGLGWVAIGQLVWLPMAEPILGMVATAGLVMAYKLLYRSTHDPLTGLPNREAFMGILNKALQNAQGQASPYPVIVVFMDIDRFKVINESLGHQAGDRVLSMLSTRLITHLPLEARAARVGGDEFALLLTGVSRGQAGEMIDKLQYALSQPMMLNGQKLPSTISMGIAITQAGLKHNPADLLRDAHTAMYRAKALGKSRFEIFSDGMLTEAVNRLQLESDLISALDNEEFLLYYQPIIRLQTGEIAGFEALVRWNQKDRGFVLPNTFIPAAEETGLIMPLGQWIFREACRQLCTWHDMFPDYPELTMSINLSNRQFSQTDLVRQIELVIDETGVKGNLIRLEITESMVMGDVDAAIDLMLRLKSLNLKLGIDDFGTGYSSLSYLHRFPMDTLKVDKSFVGRLEDSNEDRAIIHTILTLGQKLGMEVVAEGVETIEQVNLLKAEGCDYGQGYYFAKPLPCEAAQAFLKQHLSQPLIT
jgi:diguanylate cyclase (GGDEF)-like protein